MKPYLYCRQQNKELYDDERCWYQEGKVSDPSKVCFECFRFRAIETKTEPKELKPHGKSESDPQKIKAKENFSKILKGKASYPQSHLIDYLETSGIDIMFPNPAGGSYPWPVDSYLKGANHEAPFRLIDAVGEGNYLNLRISLNHKRESLIENFKRFLTIVGAELKEQGAETLKLSDRKYDQYLKVYKLRTRTDRSIAKVIFPDDLDLSDSIKKVKRIREELRKLGMIE